MQKYQIYLKQLKLPLHFPGLPSKHSPAKTGLPKKNNKLWILFGSKCYLGPSILTRHLDNTYNVAWFLTHCLDILHQDIHTLCKNVLHSFAQSFLALSDLIFCSAKTLSKLVPPQKLQMDIPGNIVQCLDSGKAIIWFPWKQEAFIGDLFA